MNLGLEWINSLFEWFVTWLPSQDLVECTHRGVKVRSSFFRRGVRIEDLEPGLYWYYPRTTKVYTCAVVRRPHDLPAQSVSTLDGKSIMISTSLIVGVINARKLLIETEEPDEVIQEIGAAAATDCVATREWEQLRKDFAEGTIEGELLEATRSQLVRYGVYVIDARLTDNVQHSAHRHEGTGMAFKEEE